MNKIKNMIKFKFKNYMGDWTMDYRSGYEIKFTDKELQKFENTSVFLFKQFEILDKYEEIVEFIKNLKELEFKGNNIDNEFAKFYEIAEKIQEIVPLIILWIKEVESLSLSIGRNEEIEILTEAKLNYMMSGDISEFSDDYINSCKLSINKLLHLIKELQDISYSLQYKIVILYFTDKELSRYVSSKTKKTKKISANVIFTVFSRASNYDIEKKLYYDRRKVVDTLTKNIHKNKENKDENSLVKLLQNKEFNNNYTINYKNIYDDDNTILALDPLLSKVYNLLGIKSNKNLWHLNSIYTNLESNSSEKDVLKSMDTIMSSGFNRIVIVESDEIFLYKNELKEFLKQIWQNKFDGKDLGENVFNLYKENIEYIKYVNPWIQDNREGKENNKNRVTLLNEIISHLTKFKRKSKKINEFKKFNTQQIYIENTFSLERITLSNLVEKLRFLLFFDLKTDYQNQNNLMKRYNKYLSSNASMVDPDLNPFFDLNLNDEIIETKNIDKLRSIFDNSSDTEIREFFRQNLFEVNNYLSHSLFIFYDLKWEDISRKFVENRITLSSGLNNKKKFLDILSYKLSVLFLKLFGEDGYKFVSKSNNKSTSTKASSELRKDIKILDAKGFGKSHRFMVDEEGVSKNLEPNKIDDNDNAYNWFLYFRTETGNNLNYLFENQERFIKELKEHRRSKEWEKQQKEINYKAMKQEEYNKSNRYIKRRYHTCSKIISINKDNKRFYSSNNLRKNDNSIFDKNENSLVNNKEIIYLYDKFLDNSSYYFTDIKKIIDEGTEKKMSLEILQNKIEEYAFNRELESGYDKLFREKGVGEFSPIITSLNKSLIVLENCLINFTSNYYINNHKNLIQELRLGVKKVNFYLLIFVIEAEIGRKKQQKLGDIKNSDYSKQSKDIFVKRVEKIKSIVGIILIILPKVILNYKSNSDDDPESSWGTITQSNLINKIGFEIIKRLPEVLPENFFEEMDDMPEKDKNYIRKYYSNEFKLFKDTIEFKGEVGSTILDLIMNADNNLNLLKINKIVTKNKKKNIYISFSDTYMELFSKKIYTPYKLPMIIAPKKWTKNKNDGGYLNSDFKRFANIYLLHKSYKNSGTSEISDLQIETINFLNKQKLKINKEILSLLVKEYYNKKSILYNGLNQLHPESKENLLYMKDYSKKVLSHNSKYTVYNQVLSIAILFRNFTFYQTTFYDFRGRIYTESDYFSYQAEDMSKSLIEFEEGCKLNDSNVIYVLQYLANLGGKSKLSIKNKEKWSIDLINNLNITKDKLDYTNFRIKDVSFKEDFVKKFNIEFLINNDLIQEIYLNNKDKFQFIVLLFNLIECLINNNKQFCTPISFDATCNGFQHLSAIFKDFEIARISNVINDSDTPNDVYKFVAENVQKLIKLEPDSDMKDKFLSINFTRNLLKKPVMTIPYNVGLEKLKNQLISDEHNFFEEKKEYIKDDKIINYYIVNKAICKNNESLQLSFKEFGKLTSFLYKGVYTTFPNLVNYVQYTKKIAAIFSSLNIPIEWETPIGMRIKMGYKQRESKPIISLFSKLRLGSVSLPLTKMDHISNRIAFMPNFIHSMDATNIQLLIQIIQATNQTKMNLITIHDCFATTPDYMFYLNKEIRLAFIMIYFQGDYIKSVHENFIKQIFCSTKLIYIKENDKLIKVKIENIKNLTLSLDLNKEYVVKINKKKYIIPRLPYNTNKWGLIKKTFERIVESKYFIN